MRPAARLQVVKRARVVSRLSWAAALEPTPPEVRRVALRLSLAAALEPTPVAPLVL